MAPDAVDELERLERLWLLPSDAKPIERLLAHEPLIGGKRQPMTRRWPCIIIAALWFVLAPTPAPAVLDGNQWRGLPESGREAYVTGVVDTWSEVWSGIKRKTVADPAYAPGAVENTLRSVSECAQPMTYGRILAIVEQYMKDHPDIWRYRMASNVFAAIQASCPQ